MPQLRWSISHIFAFTALVALGLTLLKPLMQERSNCGGNSAALSAVKQYTLIVELANEQANEAALSVATATEWQRRELGHISRHILTRIFLCLLNRSPLSARGRGA